MKEYEAEKLAEEIAEEVRQCGRIILNAKRTEDMVDAKEGHANFVTVYDRKVQEELKKRLLAVLPEAAFAGEEDENGGFNIPLEGYTFVVDPIDGTTNFIWDFHNSCISVGLLKDGRRYIGIIYNPYLDEMFSAIKGRGAYLNGRRTYVYEGDVGKTLTIFGTSPYYAELKQPSFDIALKMMDVSADVRRGGSAAIDLCCIAAGRASIYCELRLSPWDFAAGSLIVEEAGGRVTTADNKEPVIDRKNSIVARGKGMEDTVARVMGW